MDKEENKLPLAVSVVVLGIIAAICIPTPDTASGREAKVYAKARTALTVIVDPLTGRGGTGFQVQAWSGKQYTLTNAHVCKLAKAGVLVAANMSLQTMVKVEVVSTRADLCLMTGIPELKPLPVAKKFEQFQHVFVVGHPHLNPPIITSGYLLYAREEGEQLCATHAAVGDSRKDCTRQFESVRSDAVMHPGSSGSPVLSDDGDLVGVGYAINEASNLSFFVSLNEVREFLSQY